MIATGKDSNRSRNTHMTTATISRKGNLLVAGVTVVEIIMAEFGRVRGGGGEGWGGALDPACMTGDTPLHGESMMVWVHASDATPHVSFKSETALLISFKF